MMFLVKVALRGKVFFPHAMKTFFLCKVHTKTQVFVAMQKKCRKLYLACLRVSPIREFFS